MKRLSAILGALIIYMMISPMNQTAMAGDLPRPETYLPTVKGIIDAIQLTNDPTTPTPLRDTGIYIDKILPQALKDELTYDKEKMQKAWAEAVGFKSPDVVGKIAPGIKPGKYTYQDIENNPELKGLIMPQMLHRINPGQPPFGANIAEFEIIPTRQLYWSLPIAEATKKNAGKTKLDDQGYLLEETWEGGYPFPNPSGKHAAQQCIYNKVSNYFLHFEENNTEFSKAIGIKRNLTLEEEGYFITRCLALHGRVSLPPYGFYDKRAKEQGESFAFAYIMLTPRELAGQVVQSIQYSNPHKMDQMLLYLPGMRRIRKYTSTDTQEPPGGGDFITDDSGLIFQKITPDRYPYKYEILEEREYLVPVNGEDYYLDTGRQLELQNVKFARRPMVVVQMTQLDPNYVYSKRIIYIDRETLLPTFAAMYDQKDRLYRTGLLLYSYHETMGNSWCSTYFWMDHIDEHMQFGRLLYYPSAWDRKDVGMQALINLGK